LQINFIKSIGLIDHLFHSALHAIRVPAYPIGAFGLSSCKGCYACWIVKPFPITDIMWKRKYTKIIIALNGSYKRKTDLQIRTGLID